MTTWVNQKVMSKAVYDPFAKIYNEHWGSGFSERVFPLVQRLVLDLIQPGSWVLDLACGTGQMAEMIHQAGFQVLGVDQSEAMIGYARVNAPGSKFIHGDARTVELENKYHAALSLYDSLNHLLNLDDLQKVFQNVHRCLLPDGRFLFDLNMDQGYEARWSGSFHILEDDHAVLVRSTFDPDSRLGATDITIFEQEEDQWQRADITITQRAYPAEEIVKALYEAGYQAIQILDAVADLGLDGQTGRSFFLARK